MTYKPMTLDDYMDTVRMRAKAAIESGDYDDVPGSRYDGSLHWGFVMQELMNSEYILGYDEEDPTSDDEYEIMLSGIAPDDLADVADWYDDSAFDEYQTFGWLSPMEQHEAVIRYCLEDMSSEIEHYYVTR